MSTTTSTAEARPESRRREYGDDALIMCDNLVRIYQSDKIEVQALQGLDLLVTNGEMVAIVGASGSGSRPSSTCCPVWTCRRRAERGSATGTC